MSGNWLARPHGTNLVGRVVANGKDEIHFRRAGFRKLIPALTAQIGNWKPDYFQLLDRVRIYTARGMASRAVSGEIRTSFLIQNGFRENRTCGVAGTEKQHVAGHRSTPSARIFRFARPSQIKSSRAGQRIQEGTRTSPPLAISCLCLPGLLAEISCWISATRYAPRLLSFPLNARRYLPCPVPGLLNFRRRLIAARWRTARRPDHVSPSVRLLCPHKRANELPINQRRHLVLIESRICQKIARFSALVDARGLDIDGFESRAKKFVAIFVFFQRARDAAYP